MGLSGLMVKAVNFKTLDSHRYVLDFESSYQASYQNVGGSTLVTTRA
jgi:hypothetical protein